MKSWIKVVITVITGGLTYLLTNLTGQLQIWQLTMTIFVGGVTLVVQFLIDFDRQLVLLKDAQSAHAGATERIVDRGFASINEATELFSQVEKTVLRPEGVIHLVTYAADISPDEALLHRLVETEIERLSNLLRGFCDESTVSYAGEDRDWLLGLTAAVRETVDATSMTTLTGRLRGLVDDGIWTTDLGQRYLEAQRKAIEDHAVRIRRLFILDDDVALDDAGLSELIRPHSEIGVETRVLIPSKVPYLVRSSMFDFIVFDGRVSYEPSSASTFAIGTRPVVMNTALVTRKSTVAERILRFEKLWKAADGPLAPTP